MKTRKETLRLLILALLTCASFGAASAFAQEEDEDEKEVPATVDELIVAINEVLEEKEVPGIGLALVDETGPVWVGGLGKANLEDNIDADADTLFRIGSTSKMFVALAVLQLVEEGRLSLDDKLADLAPEIEFENPWEDTAPILVSHLLEHTTGWDDIHLKEYAHNDPTPATLKEGLDYHPHSRVSRWQPGTRMSYCNSGPPVAAYIVQKITGQDFEDYIQENFFDPLQMTGSTFRRSEGVLEKGATLYENGEPADYWHIIMRPSGSINASANDLARFLMMYIGRGTVDDVQYVSAESIDRMEQALTNNASDIGLQVGYGLHNYTSSHESWVYRGHNGGVNGGLTELMYMREAGIGYAFSINAGNGAAFGEISKLIRNFQTQDLPKPEVPDSVELSEADLSLAGTYHGINPRQQNSYFMGRITGMKLWFEDGLLKHQGMLGGDVTELRPAGNGLFRSPDNGLIVMARANDPLAGPVLHYGTWVAKPISPVIAWLQLGIAILWGVAILSSFLYALVWGVRKLRGKIPAGPSTRIRIWPLLAGLSIAAFVVLFSVATSTTSNVFETLGQPTAISISLTVISGLFAVFAGLAGYTAYSDRNAEMNRVNYWYCAVCSYLHVIAAAYLLWFGVVGLQTWA